MGAFRNPECHLCLLNYLDDNPFARRQLVLRKTGNLRRKKDQRRHTKKYSEQAQGVNKEHVRRESNHGREKAKFPGVVKKSEKFDRGNCPRSQNCSIPFHVMCAQ